MSQTKTQLVEGLNINTSAPADALAVDDSGRVGVGTSSPNAPLDIKPSTNVAQLQLTQNNASDGWQFHCDGPNGGNLYLNRLVSSVASTTFTILGSGNIGNVGIGTTSPRNALHVISSNGDIRIDTSTNGGAAGLIFDVPASNGLRASGHRAKIQCEHTGSGWESNLIFYGGTTSTEPSEQMRLTSNNYLRLASGTNGIQFHGDTAAANALDDYEEGTFTPSINSGYTVSYDVASGRYAKVGALVAIWLDIDTSSHSGSSSDTYAYINGLPFTVKNTGFIDTGFSVAWIYNLANNVDHCYADGGQTRLVLLGPNSSGSRTHWNPAQVWGTSGDRRLAISGVYYTDS